MKRHDSMRGYFAYELHQQMEKDDRIWTLTGDLGFGMLDSLRDDFPDRFVNCGAAEFTMMGMAVGMSYEGKIPFVYSITPFLLARPYEMIRNYVDRENLPVKLVGSGRDYDYAHDGFSHQATDARAILNNFPNIEQFWPESKEEIPDIVRQMVKSDRPQFISLRR